MQLLACEKVFKMATIYSVLLNQLPLPVLYVHWCDLWYVFNHHSPVYAMFKSVLVCIISQLSPHNNIICVCWFDYTLCSMWRKLAKRIIICKQSIIFLHATGMCAVCCHPLSCLITAIKLILSAARDPVCRRIFHLMVILLLGVEQSISNWNAEMLSHL